MMVLDLMMPGLDGYEVTMQMKRNLATRHIPVLIISALDDRATKKRVLSAGAVDFITKPIDRSLLCERVRSILRLAATG
jgi:DNA-binding response OmpR family regulator